MTKLHYYGKTCISISDDTFSVLINPNFSNNWDNFKSIDQIKANLIILTKYNEKTLNDVIRIAKNNEAVIMAAPNLIQKLREFGIVEAALISVYVGQRFDYNQKLNIHFLPSLSNSNLPGNLAMSLLLDFNGTKYYHDGYTAYYSDLKLLKKYKINYALISVSQYSSKNYEDARLVVDDLEPEFFIPMHYDKIEKDRILALRDELLKDTKTIPVVLEPNSGIIINNK